MMVNIYWLLAHPEVRKAVLWLIALLAAWLRAGIAQGRWRLRNRRLWLMLLEGVPTVSRYALSC